MRLQFNNINIVEQADIKLDGLTVIAGENGSGKSTVGKLLFSTVKAVSNLNSVKQDYKQKTITKYVESIYKRVSSSRFRLNASILNDVFPMPYYRLIDKFMAIYNDEVLDQETKCAQYHEIIDKMISTINNIDEFTPRIKKLIQDDLNNIAICLEETDNLAADLATEIKYLIESEFMNRICSFNTSESNVRLQLDNKEPAPHVVEYNLTDDEIKGTKVKIDLAESLDDATYIESPLYIHLLDSLLSASTFREISDKRRIGLKPMIPVHIKDIAEKINAARYIHEDDIQELMIDDKGAFVFKDRSLYYQKDGVLYSPINVASGLKAFGLIQLLLETNVINERKMLIWDEPENHLHPKWQVAFASVLVDLAKNGVPVVISTHSPYFVQGIRYFAAKQDIEKYVNYYLAEKQDVNSLATIKDVTTDLNQIFVKLATPLNEIMNVDEIRKNK